MHLIVMLVQLALQPYFVQCMYPSGWSLYGLVMNRYGTSLFFVHVPASMELIAFIQATLVLCYLEIVDPTSSLLLVNSIQEQVQKGHIGVWTCSA
jgi:hypothetical protein